jgi:hypothetical protein
MPAGAAVHGVGRGRCVTDVEHDVDASVPRAAIALSRISQVDRGDVERRGVRAQIGRDDIEHRGVGAQIKRGSVELASIRRGDV